MPRLARAVWVPALVAAACGPEDVAPPGADAGEPDREECPAGAEVPDGWSCIPATGPGGFPMGTPEDQIDHREGEDLHPVLLTRPYLMRQTEVTQAEWTALMGENPSYHAEGGRGGCHGDPCDVRPVEQITWFLAVAYANAASTADGLPACYRRAGDGEAYGPEDAEAQLVPVWPEGLDCPGDRLPTEAEWERAARAGTTTPFSGGGLANVDCWPVDPVLDRLGWYCGNSDLRTHPVGPELPPEERKEPNPWGLYDVHGNVWEWTWDLHAEYPGSATDPLGAEAGETRVFRGGSMEACAGCCRSGNRYWIEPWARWTHLGLRLARTLPSP